jgi:hypothetical protein
MPSLASLRAQNKEWDNFNDEEMLLSISEQTGVPLRQVARDFKYDAPKSDFGKELSAGWANFKGNLEHIGAAMQESQNDIPEKFRTQPIVDRSTLGRWADQNSTKAQVLQSLSNMPHSWDEVSVGDDKKGLIPYLKQGAAQMLPMFGEAAAWTAADVLSKGRLTPQIIERYGTEFALRRGATEEAAKKFGTNVARGTSVGAGVYYPNAVGDILSNQYDQSGEYNLPYALAGGVPYAALDAALGLEGSLARRSMTRGLVAPTSSRAINALKGFGTLGAEEAIGEVGQEVINQVGRNTVDSSYDPFGPQARAAYKESAILSSMLGGIPGGIHGTFRSRGSINNIDEADLLNVADPEYKAALDRANATTRPDYIGQSLRQGANVNLQDWVNQQLGIGGDLSVKRADVKAALGEKLETPTIVLDANGQPYTTDSAADFYEFQQFGRTSKNAKANQTSQAGAVVEEQEPWNYVHPQTGEALPTPAELKIGGQKKVQAYKTVAEAFSTGLLNDDEFNILANSIQSTKKIGALTTRINKEIAAAKENFANQEQEATADQQSEQQTDVQNTDAQGANALTTAITQQNEQNAGNTSLQTDIKTIANALSTLVSPDQMSWLTARQDPLNENKSDAQLASELGFSRQNASKLTKTSLKTLVRKVAKQVNQSPADVETKIRNWLRASAPRAVATENPIGMSPAQQQSVIDDAELVNNNNDSSMGVIESIGGSQRGNMSVGKTTLPPGYVESVLPSNNARAQGLQDRAQTVRDVMTNPEAKNAALDWDDARYTWDELPMNAKFEFTADYIEAVQAMEEYEWDAATFEEKISEAQSEVESKLQGGQYANQKNRVRNDATEVANLESRSASSDAEGQSTVRSIGQTSEDTTTDRDTTGSDADELAKLIAEQEQDDTDVVDEGRQSVGKVENPTTEATIIKLLNKLFSSPETFQDRVVVFRNEQDAINAGLKPEQVRGIKGLAFGNKGVVALIASNIEKGRELGVFLHEMGVHIGLENLLGVQNMKRLAGQINKWAALNNDSIEARIAKAAMARVETAKAKASKWTAEDEAHEMIAYFVEESVNAGINPLAVNEIKSAGLREWYRRFTAAMKAALRKFNINKLDTLTAQNIVDLAYGAADLELSGEWHGTAANFRKFDHRYMGTGEGNQAFGWGTYLAERLGIAKDYFKNEVNKKTRTDQPTVTYEGMPLLRAAEYYMAEAKRMLDKKDYEGRRIASDKAVVLASLYKFGNVTKNGVLSDRVLNNFDKDNILDRSKFEVKQPQKTAGTVMRTRALVGKDEMLNWDKPLDEQSDKVKSIIATLPTEILDAAKRLVKDVKVSSITPGLIGRELYRFNPSGQNKPITIDNSSVMRQRAGQVYVRVTDQNGGKDWINLNEVVTGETGIDNAIARSATQSLLDKMDAYAEREVTGEHLYRAIHELADTGKYWNEAGVEQDGDVRKAQMVASKYLDNLGIKGINYYDATTRDNIRDTARINKELFRLENELEAIQAKYPTGRGYNVVDFVRSSRISKQINKLVDDKTKVSSIRRNRVVFNDKNISRASSRIGDDKENVRFSRLDDEPTDQESTIRYKADSKRKAVMTDMGSALRKLAPSLLNNFQLVDQFGTKLKSLVSYMNSSDKMTVMQQRIVRQSHDILQAWNAFRSSSKKMAERLDKLMHDATILGIHPDLAFEDEMNNHLTKDDQDKYDELSRRYNSLPDNAKDIYQQVKKMLADNWELRKNIYADVVKLAYSKQMELAKTNNDQKEIDRIQAKIDKEIADHSNKIKEIRGPYFPLMRFGDFIVVAESKELQAAREQLKSATGEEAKNLSKKIAVMEKDGAHYQVHSFDKESEQQAMAQKLERTHDVRLTKGEEYQRELRPATFGQIQQLDAMLGAEFGGSNVKGISQKIRDAITEMYLASLPEHSALQRQIKRHGIQGASTDMMRSFAEAVERDSFYLSRMRYMPDMTSALYQMKEESKASNQLRDVYNNVKARMAMDFTYTRNPFAANLSKLSSIWHLGISPSYLIVNSSQPWAITVPQLAGKFGATRATNAMASAWADAGKIIKAGRDGKFFSLKNADLSKSLSGDELRMAEELQDLGKFDIAQNIDTEIYASGTDPKFIKAQRVFNWTSHNIELVNRLSTGLATYRLERSRGATHEQATAKAREMIELTQLTYDDTNAAYFMKAGHLGGWNRIPMQFRKYQQGMVYLIVRNAKEAYKGDPEAKRALAYMLVMQSLLAGARFGIPLAFPLSIIASMFGDDDDEKGDLETQFRNYLTDVLGETAATVFWKGLPTLIGLDISRNIGLGEVFNPLPMIRWSDVTDARTGKEGIKELLYQMAGAPVATMGDFLDAGQMAMHGDLQKATEKVLPKFLASPLKAARYMDEGMTTRNGKQVMDADEFSAWELAYKALGFSPLTETQHYDAQNVKSATARAITERRNRLIAEYARTKLERDDLSDIKEEIKDFNAEHPHTSTRITASVLFKAMQRRKSSRKSTDAAGVEFRKTEKYLRPVDRFATEDEEE